MNKLPNILLTGVLFLLIGLTSVFGKELPFQKRISYGFYGSVVTVGTPNAFSSVATNSGGIPYVDLSTTDYISLGIDHNQFISPNEAYEIEVDILIKPYINNVAQPTFVQTLTVAYHPFSSEEYKDKAIKKFLGADKFDFTFIAARKTINGVVSNVTDLPNNIYIDGDIIVDRIEDFTSYSSNPVGFNPPVLIDLDCDTDTPPEDVQISWVTQNAAYEYQLEWTFVNDYDGTVTGTNVLSFGSIPPGSLAFDFRNNSTRISTTNTSYNLPLVFENGYLLYRVRAVGFNTANQRIYGVWSTTLTQDNIANFSSSTTNSLLYNQMAHEVRKNWQLTTTFAEEGKKKEVISYYDGSLRNRQSVTVVNSDDNVIVGETIYDHQGRPAINVLPVPVIRPNCNPTSGDNSRAPIKYYPQFNKATGDVEYTKDKFDFDAGSCATSLTPMSSGSGASNYYSEDNPNKEAHQAYVPNANGYPFTQVEYTPDNTGRIRQQSGVGPEFQLGGGHQSKYFYGKPFQISLDRLFASEVGYGAHYKKNLVVDPNGQVSVSYLDQEGRVIATALAGEKPQNLEAIESLTDLGADGVDLNVDVFEKDVNNFSTTNALDAGGNSIVFSQEILVSTEGNYHFTYNLTSDAYTEDCTPDLCFNCVYDLKLLLTDECGNKLKDVNAPYEDIYFQEMEGHFERHPTNDSVTFVTTCESNGLYESDTYDFTTFLSVGNYTVTKVLTVNSNAISSAFQAYVSEGEQLGCVDSLGVFLAEEMALLDTSGCNISCDQCAASLGTLDEFISAGNGSASDYELLKEECLAPCKTKTFCETIVEILRADMSPNGQYGQYEDPLTGNLSLNSYPLSVYRVFNKLPYNSFNTPTENWRHPSVIIDGTTYDYYLDAAGDSAKIFLTIISGQTIPSVQNFGGVASTTDDVHYDLQTGLYYTYPDRLSSVVDFIEEFEYPWSQSLVVYHPEYKYYETCLGYEEENSDGISSTSFDQLMNSAITFNDAVNKGLVVLGSGSSYEVANYGNPSSSVYDPFITSGNYGNYGNSLLINLNVYQNIGGQTYSMQEFASIVVRCGNNNLSGNTSLLSACAGLFGDNPGSFTVTNDEEWEAFKGLYQGKKREYKNLYGDDQTLGGIETYLNDCIGNVNFNPYTSGIWNPFNGSFSFPYFNNNPYYNTDNACSHSKKYLYANKTKRFPDNDDYAADATANNGSYQSYLQTGQCPNAFNLGELINNVAIDNQLENTSLAIFDYPGWGLLYGSLNNGDYTNGLPSAIWSSNVSNGDLTVNISDQQDINCDIRFINNGQIQNWSDIVDFTGLNSTGLNAVTGLYEFTIVAELTDGSFEDLLGTTCFNIENCTFEEVCSPNDLAKSVEEVFTLLASDNQFVQASTYSLNSNPFMGSAVNGQLLNELGASTINSLQWDFTGNNNVASITNGGVVIAFYFNTTAPANFTNYSSIAYFDNIQSEYQHYFAIDGFDVFGNLLVHINGEVLRVEDGENIAVSMGECELPTPIDCNTNEHLALEDLNTLLTDVLTTSNYNIFTSGSLTGLLTGYFGNATSSEGTLSDTTYTLDINGTRFMDPTITEHNLSLDLDSSDCNLDLMFQLNSSQTTSNFTFNDIISIGDIIGVGAPINNSYYEFEFYAVFNNGGVDETILVTGTSCIPLKNCDLCNDSLIVVPPLDSVVIAGGDGYNYNALIASSSNDGATLFSITAKSTNEEVDLGDCQKLYDEYVTLIGKYNDSEYALFHKHVLVPVSSAVFLSEGYCECIEAYLEYLTSYLKLTSKSEESLALNIDESEICNEPVDLGDCQKLYDEYVSLIGKYNDSEYALFHEHVLVPVSPSIFLSEGYCECVEAYLEYLTSYLKLPAKSEESLALNIDESEICNEPVDLGDCQKLYDEYVVLIGSYNNSEYALFHEHVLVPVSPAIFLSEDYCECVEAYLEYLTSYLKLPAKSEESLALNIDELDICNEVIICEERYNEYLESIVAYNNNVKIKGLGWPTIEVVYSYEQFMEQGLCNCVEGYIAYLNSLTSGVILVAPNEDEVKIQFYCAPPPCVPSTTPVVDTITPITIVYVDPCVEQALNIAALNAEIAYQDYLNGLASTFSSNMKNHCLGVEENMRLDFKEKEYHYTLYYYDQAGNLIKTVPPEGVELVNTFSSTDDLSVAINTDRTNKVQTQFAYHRLATKYLYNSLNQLTKQSLPDHDQMDIFEYSLTNGLDANLEVMSTQFVSESKGYLAGHVGDKGILYTTHNGGKTWSRVLNTLGSDLQAIDWVDGNYGIAIGTDGILIKTVNGGYVWEMINTYTNNITSQLNDVTLNSNGTGLVVGNNGTILQLSNVINATVSITTITPLVNDPNYAITSDDHITAIEDDNGDYYITVDFKPTVGERFGLVYTSADGTNWTVLEKVKIETITDIQAINDNNYVGIGLNGTFVKSIDGGVNWYVQEVASKEAFKAIYFSSLTDGLAIRENGILYTTQNGGTTWSILTADGTYNALFAYESTKVLIVGDNGAVGRVIMTANTSFGITEETQNLFTDNLTTCWAGGYPEIAPTSTVSMVVSGVSNIRFSDNISVANPNWRTLTSNVGSIVAIKGKAVGVGISGVLLNSIGELYSFNLASISGTMTTSLISSAGEVYTSIAQDIPNGLVVAYDNTNQKLKNTAITAPSTPVNFSISFPTSQTIDKIAVSATGNTYLLSNNLGEIFKVTQSGTVIADQTLNVRPLLLNDEAVVGDRLIVVGNNGTLLQHNLGGGSGNIKQTTNVENYNAIDAYAFNGILVGDLGVINKVDNLGIITPVTTTIADNLLAVGVDNANNAYFGSETGKIYRTTDYTLANLNIQTVPSTSVEAINAIEVNTINSRVSYVGNNSAMYQGSLGMASQIKLIYTPSLLDVNFSSLSNGYVVGENYTVRHTTDGGVHWNTILPINGFTGGTVPQLNTVFTQNNNEALIGGEAKYLARANNVSASAISLISTGNIFSIEDIDFADVDAGKGILVGGDNANNGKIMSTIDGGINWVEISNINGAKKLNGIHAISRNNTYIVVGNEENIFYVNGTSVSNINASPTSTNNLYDVFFKDDINGYAVGDAGILLKSFGGIINQNTGLLTNIAWTDEPTADNYTNGSQTIRTIDFTTPFNGFLGGSLASGTVNYARLLRDESGKFSTNFYYDKLGRIVASQNSKQYAASIKRYSYTLYDRLGRVVEAGEKEENTNPFQQFSSVYGALVGGLINPSVIDDSKLKAWITNSEGVRKEVTHSYYDLDLLTLGITVPTGFSQDASNLRKRISAVTYEKVYDGYGLDDSYNYATFYDYDIHGNVKTLIQHNNEIGANLNQDVSAQEYKRMDYEYDLISGNVHEVAYQAGEVDAWYHKYTYDADNRIVKTKTSQDKVTWDTDAGYIYYDHGPLARTEIGQLNVQGNDYAYTLQGWLKGVNSDMLSPENDMGKDGLVALGNPNESFARDAYGFSLTYYEGDYSPIDYVNKWQQQNQRFASVLQGSDVIANRSDLHNGNIGSMVTTITKSTIDAATGVVNYNALPQATAYHYDQLNRLTAARAFQNLDVNTNSTSFNTWGNTGSYNNLYYNDFTYDASGNILHQNRHDHLGNRMDDLDYHYATDVQGGKLLQNRLYSVTENDHVHNALYDDDIEDMGYAYAPIGIINNGTQNYQYDEIGQLVQDKQEGISEIKWRVDGKISAIIRARGDDGKNLTFDYDPMGNRIAKHIYGNQSFPSTGTAVFDPDNIVDWEKTTYYNRDAQGNVMATYDYMVDVNQSTKFSLTERNIYGSSRVGMERTQIEMIGATTNTDSYNHNIGNKFYEMSNHLGNVLAVVTDKKIYNSNVTLGLGYIADIAKSTDYSPFGVELYERGFTRDDYRYGFNGMEKDDEVKGGGNSYTTFFRQYDPRLGRWATIDPMHAKFANESPYVAFHNSPIFYPDPRGDDPIDVVKVAKEMILKSPTFNELINRLATQNNATTQQILGLVKVDPNVNTPETKNDGIYLPPSEDKNQVIEWISHEFNNLDPTNFEKHQKINQTLGDQVFNGEETLISKESYTNQRIAAEVSSVVCRWKILGEMEIEADDKIVQGWINDYKETGNLKALTQHATDEAKQSMVTDPNDGTKKITIQTYYSRQYDNVVKEATNNKKMVDEKK